MRPRQSVAARMRVTCQQLGRAGAGPLPGSRGTVSLFVCTVSRPAACAARMGISLFIRTSCRCRGSWCRDPFQQPWELSGKGCRLEAATGNLGVLFGVIFFPPTSFIFCPSELKRDKNKLVSAKTSSLSIVCSQVSSAGMFGNAGGHHGPVPRLPTRVGVAEPIESHGEEPVLRSRAGGSSR